MFLVVLNSCKEYSNFKSEIDYLIMSWLESGSLDGTNNNEGVKKMALDAGGTKWGIISFNEHNANDIVSNVTLLL